jgi:hypothetical protein
MLHVLPEEHSKGDRQKKPNDVREFHARSIYQSKSDSWRNSRPRTSTEVATNCAFHSC